MLFVFVSNISVPSTFALQQTLKSDISFARCERLNDLVYVLARDVSKRPEAMNYLFAVISLIILGPITPAFSAQSAATPSPKSTGVLIDRSAAFPPKMQTFP